MYKLQCEINDLNQPSSIANVVAILEIKKTVNI